MKSSFLYSFKNYRRFFLSGLIIVFMSWFCFAGWDLVDPAPTDMNLLDVHFIDSSTGWAVGRESAIGIRSGIILKTSDGGVTWTIVSLDTNKIYSGVKFFDKNNGWIFGGEYFKSRGAIFIWKTSDGGNTLDKVYVDSSSFLRGHYFISKDTGWVVGHEGFMIKTIDGGQTWEEDTISELYDFFDVFFIDANTGWACGEDMGDEGIICHTKDGGKSWTKQFDYNNDVSFNSIYFTDLNNGWAVGYMGMIWGTSDGGKNWKEQVQAGTNNPSLADVHFTDKLTGWTIGGGKIFRTADGGKDWNYIDIVITERGYSSLYFTDHYHGWIVGSEGSILRTTDGGGFPQPILYNPSISNQYISLQNYPNPFSKTTTITYFTKQKGTVTIEIYNLFGKKIRTLLNQYKSSGKHSIQWNGTNDKNLPVSKGVYYSVVTVDTGTEKIRQREKMVLQ